MIRLACCSPNNDVTVGRTELSWGCTASDSSKEETKVHTEPRPESRINSTDKLPNTKEHQYLPSHPRKHTSRTHLHSVVEHIERLSRDVMHKTRKLLHRPLTDLVLGKVVDVREVKGGITRDLCHEFFLQQQGLAGSVHCYA
jgi:hypothetical protein